MIFASKAHAISDDTHKEIDPLLTDRQRRIAKAIEKTDTTGRRAAARPLQVEVEPKERAPTPRCRRQPYPNAWVTSDASGTDRNGGRREAHQHPQATPVVIADFPFSARAPHQPLNDCQPQPAMAVAAACRIEPHERPARIDQILRGDPAAMSCTDSV